MESTALQQSSYGLISEAVVRASKQGDALHGAEAVQRAASKLFNVLPDEGRGDEETVKHLMDDVVPGFNGQKTSANYYGFVTGGVLPVAEVADNIVTAFDQSLAVHLPEQSVSTVVEDRALKMLQQLLNLGVEFEGRTFTTGATASNVLGLACGREAIINARLPGTSVAKTGLLSACMEAGVKEIQVLTSMGHSSLYKAASIVGLGSGNVYDVADSDLPWKLDLSKLETLLSKKGSASIVSVSCGEVNTGRFATDIQEMQKIRSLCDKYKAWLHIDGAFGLFSRALPQTSTFTSLHSGCAGIELADSITGDNHKSLNVPYDCGFFFTKSLPTLTTVFQNPNAAYLSAVSSDGIPSPLNIGIENSRRFRALPVYSVLVAYGRAHLQDMFAKQVLLARAVAEFVKGSEKYELLNAEKVEDVGIVVMFKATDKAVNEKLVASINKTGRIMVSGTKWAGEDACRIAVSTWKIDVQRDGQIVSEVLEAVAR